MIKCSLVGHFSLRRRIKIRMIYSNAGGIIFCVYIFLFVVFEIQAELLQEITLRIKEIDPLSFFASHATFIRCFSLPGFFFRFFELPTS